MPPPPGLRAAGSNPRILPAPGGGSAYHRAVHGEPAFDPRWLEALAGSLWPPAPGRRRLLDLYLERRLEHRVVSRRGRISVAELRDEGCAARWAAAGPALAAANGCSPRAVRAVLAAAGHEERLPRLRPAPAADLEPPSGWRRWALETAARLAPTPVVLRLLLRRAAVVRRGAWCEVQAPPLLLAHAGPGRSVLAPWPRPGVEELLAAPPARRGAHPPEPGTRLPVLFTAGTAGALLHEAVGHLAESDLVATGASPLAGLLGAAVAPPSLEVTDDPTRADLPGAFSHDDEGIGAVPRTVLREGELAGWLCDLDGARATGQPPGRGRRSSWRTPPEPRMSNLVAAPGTVPPAELEARLGHGLVVTEVSAATAQRGSGTLLVSVESAWEVAPGRGRRPLAPFALAGEVLRVLAGIAPELGDDPTPDPRFGWCRKGGRPLPTGIEAPSMIVEGLTVV